METNLPNPETLAKMFKALAHPARIKIIEHLKSIDKCICGEIVNILPLSQSTVSQHLKQLKECGFVMGEIDGPATCYCLNPEALETFKQAVMKL